MNEIPSNPTLCVLPWLHSFVNYNGRYQVCCISEEYLLAIPDKDGIPFNIKNRPSLIDVMNSDTFKKLRLDMLNGVWNSICTRCLESESMGGTSRRNLENIEYADLITNLIEKTRDDGAIDVEFKSIDYRLGNLCNLQCRMCSPSSTSLWIKDWNTVKLEDEQISKDQALEFENFDWIEKEFLLEEFKLKLPLVNRLHFAGGEPLIAPQMISMLKICVDLNVADKITLSYNTNITQLPKKVLELWKNFKEVRLLCSVDGFGKTNDYIRHPSKWELLDKNLTFLDLHGSDYKITEIIISTTVQIYNILDIEKLYGYVKNFKNIVHALNLINLHEPAYMQTTVLPEEIKKLAADRLLAIAKDLEFKLPAHYEYLRENIFQVVNYMTKEKMTHLLPKFKKVNASMDKVKNLSLHECLPELNILLWNYCLKD